MISSYRSPDLALLPGLVLFAGLVLLAGLMGGCSPTPPSTEGAPPDSMPEAKLSEGTNVAAGTTVGEVESRHDMLYELVPEEAQIEVLADGLDWSEGPVWVPGEDFLLFSDVPANRIYKWREGEGISVWLEPSGYTGSQPRGGEPGSNGLMLDPQGRLVMCQHGDRRVARHEGSWSSPESRFATVADTYQDMKFNSPNDLVYDPQGNLYFTDPPYGLEGGVESPDREIPANGVYRLTPTGEVELVIGNLTRPNGIAFSPDGRVLYVANSDPEHAVWMAYDVFEDGVVSPGRVFLDATEWVSQAPGLPDGLAIDQAGNLFATGPGGVWVITPFGAHIGTIRTTQPTANCAFGGVDGSWLYMTADRYLLRIKLATRGLGFGE